MLNTSERTAVVVRPDEGRALNILGHSATAKLSSRETRGDAYVFEVVTPPGHGIPPHVHQNEDEIIYVVEGMYEIFLSGETYEATEGATIHFPRHIAHGFRNIGGAPGKTLWIVTPGASFERFFDDLNALPADGPPDMGVVVQIFARYGMEVLG